MNVKVYAVDTVQVSLPVTMQLVSVTENVPLGGKVLSVTKVLYTVTDPFFNINMYIIDDIGIEYAADVY